MKEIDFKLTKDDVVQVGEIAKALTRPDLIQAAVSVQPLFVDMPMRLPLPAEIVWMSPEPVQLPYGTAPLGPPRLGIWPLPDGLVSLAATPGRTVLPRFAPRVATTDVATGEMRLRPVHHYGWGTQVTVRIKRLPAVSTSPTTAFTYELIGTNEYDVVLLERLLGDQAGWKQPNFISDLVLLYPPPDGSVKEGLQCDRRGNAQDPKVAMALTKANMSTVTKPPQPATPAPGAALSIPTCYNTPFEFLSLLWECSITRSGGFYLYYYSADAQGGFPDAIFNDKGEAAITLLVLYGRPEQEPDWNRVAGYMSCLVTGEFLEAGATLLMESSPQRVEGYHPAAGETLAGLAERYFMLPTVLAADNAEQPLREGLPLTVRGGVYQVRAGREPGANLERIAAYFGTTAEQIRAANPQIREWPAELPVDTALHLPAVTVTVGRERQTLQQIAAYYNVPVEQLAAQAENRDRPGLFADTARLRIEGGPKVRTVTVPPGVTSLEVQRQPPAVAELGENDWGTLYLQRLYHLLGYQVWENPNFVASQPGLPVGPAREWSPAEQSDQSGASLGEGPEWLYRRAVPYWRFVRKGFQRTADGLPDPAQSPYAGMGRLLQMDLGWHDPFGNRLATATMGPHGPVNRPPIRTGYTDLLVALGEWPGVLSEYRVEQGPQLVVELRFGKERYARQGQERAQADLPVYRRLYYQVCHDTVELAVETSLLAQPRYVLTASQVEKLREWLEAVYQFIDAVAGGGGQPQPPAPLRLEVPLQQLNPSQIFELTVAFTMNRRVEAVDPGFRDVVGVWRAVTPVLPGQGTGKERSLRLFAEELERALSQRGRYLLKLASGPTRRRVARSAAAPLWLVRLALTDAEGICWRILNPGAPTVYAPRPIATKLLSRPQVAIADYQEGSGVPINLEQPQRKLDFGAVDVDAWVRQFAEAVDRFLAPDFTSPARIVGRLKGNKNYVGQLLKHKKTLAAAMKKLVRPVLNYGENQRPGEREQQAAEEAFEQQLLGRLGSLYSTDAVIQFRAWVEASIPRLNEEDTAEKEPQLYGYLEAKPDSGTAHLTSPKLPLVQAGEEDPALLTFLMSTGLKPRELTGRSVTLNLAYRPTHIEHQVTEAEWAEGYRASSWLSFVRPLGEDEWPPPPWSDLGKFQVPLVLRAFPVPPSLVSQEMEADQPGAEPELEKLCRWHYRFGYSEDYHYPQDRIHFTVHFNVGQRAALAAAEPDLVTALAQFITVYPALERDLLGYLARVGPTARVDDPEVKIAWAALESLVAVVGLVARMWEQGKVPEPEDALATAAESVTFTLGEEADGDNLVARWTWTSPLPPGMGLPEVLIDGYQTVRSNEPDGHSFRFRGKDGKFLSAQQGLAIPGRVVRLPELNILARQDALVTAQIRRNEQLVDKPTAPEFIYETARVEFADPLRPTVDVAEAVVDIARIKSRTPVSRTLAEHLQFFLGTLFSAPGVPAEQVLQVECQYAYALQPNLPQAQVSLSVLLLPPTKFNVRQGPAELAGKLADSIAHWAQAQWPAGTLRPASGVLWFDLVVMSNLTARPMPLLRLRQNRLETRYVQGWSEG